MDATGFALALAQIVALADNGHTMRHGGTRMARSNRVEIRLAPFGNEFQVLRSRIADADLLGTSLVAIDGTLPARLREAADTVTGGLPAWRDRHATSLFESPLQADSPRPDLPGANVPRLLLPGVTSERIDGMPPAGWSLLPLDKARWSLRDAEQPFRWRVAPNIDTPVIDLRRTFSSASAAPPAVFDAVRAAVAQAKPQNLVLDLRLNGGGDLTRARDFGASLLTLVPGSVFVLTRTATPPWCAVRSACPAWRRTSLHDGPATPTDAVPTRRWKR